MQQLADTDAMLLISIDQTVSLVSVVLTGKTSGSELTFSFIERGSSKRSVIVGCGRS